MEEGGGSAVSDLRVRGGERAQVGGERGHPPGRRPLLLLIHCCALALQRQELEEGEQGKGGRSSYRRCRCLLFPLASRDGDGDGGCVDVFKGRDRRTVVMGYGISRMGRTAAGHGVRREEVPWDHGDDDTRCY